VPCRSIQDFLSFQSVTGSLKCVALVQHMKSTDKRLAEQFTAFQHENQSAHSGPKLLKTRHGQWPVAYRVRTSPRKTHDRLCA
jgi:hypothetical protein